ncbi:hypothetical protein PIB30_033298 [Stylosanthes scabra]|uniref:Uncharacterized protein n=1 Tax=Stylosanthes scabra TaxID=79078 RepID=A0ABU6SCF0_9FABA|nr:hypothetical protein [Stylosanthes scabra]
MANHKRKLCKYTGRLAPVQQQKLHDIIMPTSAGWDAFGVETITESSTKSRVPCKYVVAAIGTHRNGGYSPDDFVYKSLTMKTMRATYNYVVHPVPSEEYWTPTVCEGIKPPPIVRPAGRSKERRIKDHVDMIIGNKEATTSAEGNSGNSQAPPINPMEKARKQKKKKPKLANSAGVGQADEVDASQSAPTPDDTTHHAPAL